ncbi:unnamed protein product, partial [Ceratitis capitata]
MLHQRQHLETKLTLIAFSTAATQTGAMITFLSKLYIKKAEHAVQPAKIAKHASRLSNGYFDWKSSCGIIC